MKPKKNVVMKPPLLGYEPLPVSDSIYEFIDFVDQGENVGLPILHSYLVMYDKKNGSCLVEKLC